MPKRKDNTKLTSREMDVLNVLWAAGEPMIASDIIKADTSLNINTVQVALRNLLKMDYVEVAEIVYSGTVLCRSYRPTAYAKDQTTLAFTSQYEKLSHSISRSNLFAALLDAEGADDSLISELESLIEKKKSALEEKK